MKSTYRIQKLECTSCVMVIEGVCEDHPGVAQASVQVHEKTLTVEHEQDTDLAQLEQQLEQSGYSVERI